MILSIIAAVAKNGVIGKDNRLPWNIPEDLAHFKKITSGHTVIMGRKTFESIGKPLLGRTNIVITRNRDFSHEQVHVVHSIKEAIRLARDNRESEAFIIGGAEIYKQALPLAHKIYLTRIDKSYRGDAYFPELGPEWKETECIKKDGYQFCSYEK